MLCLLFWALAFFYLYRLNRRLTGPNPAFNKFKTASLSSAELDAVNYRDVDMLKAIPRQPTMCGYAVLGGSGFVGSYLVRLLILRGEKYIRIIDVVAPPEDLASHPSVTFISCDISNFTSVEAALSQPFEGLGQPPTVIHHTASVIRFWERASYLYPLSYRVNVTGTQNVLNVAKRIPGAMVVYTSTVDVARPYTKYLRVDLDHEYSNAYTLSDYYTPPRNEVSPRHYTQTKAIADKLVSEAHDSRGLKTASIRPGWAILGANDLTVASALKEDPAFGLNWRSNPVCVWDVAASHLCLEDALRHRPDEVGGQSFLITGQANPWSGMEIRKTIQHYSSKPIEIKQVPVLMMYILGHFIEHLAWLRYYTLKPFYAIFGQLPSVSPKWMGLMLYLQPAMMEFMDDVFIDHSRAEKMIGYKPQWSTEQCLRWAVEEMQSGKTPGSSHRLG